MSGKKLMSPFVKALKNSLSEANNEKPLFSSEMDSHVALNGNISYTIDEIIPISPILSIAKATLHIAKSQNNTQENDSENGNINFKINDFILQNNLSTLAAEQLDVIGLSRLKNDQKFAGMDGSGFAIAILDTGIDLNHSFFGSDLDGNGISDRIVYSQDFTGEGDNTADDIQGHGTNVASIAASSDSVYGGVASGANIIGLQVLDNSGSGFITHIETALQWVIANAAKYNIAAINMSLGMGNNSNVNVITRLSDEFLTLKNMGIINVAAAGNSYYEYQQKGVSSPAADASVIAVGATYYSDIGSVSFGNGAKDITTGVDRIVSFSQRSDTMVDIFAPGANITAAGVGGGLSTMYGTSQATPHIAGLAALAQEIAMRDIGRRISQDEFIKLMKDTGVSIIDGDDENDNVSNTGDTYKRIDVYAFANAIETLFITGTEGNDILNGTVNNDSLRGLGGDDTLYGHEGDDILMGGAGIDTLQGGAGNDTYITDTIKDIITENANEGTDTIQSSATYTLGANIENLTLTGTSNIRGTGNELNNIITGNGAANTLDGKVGVDTMIGGAGHDVYIVDNINDIVSENGNEGTDRVNSSVSYTLGANIEYIQLTGTANINATGNSLNNFIYAGVGNNIIDGGAGGDTLSYADTASAISVNLALLTAQDTGGSGIDTIINVEHLIGSTYNDTLAGNSAANALNGGVGNDTLSGGAGNDTLNGGTDADIMIGGTGNDTYTVDNAGDIVTENLNEGTDKVNSSLTYILSDNVENLTLTGTTAINGTGNGLNNVLTGNSAVNTLDGGAGNDTLNGAGGDDTYSFNIGDAIDTVYDLNGTANAGTADVISFGAGITTTSVALFKSGNNLMFSYGTSDLLTITNQSNINNAIEKFTLSDGNYLTSANVDVIIQSMNAYAVDNGISLIGIESVQNNQALMNIVASAWHT